MALSFLAEAKLSKEFRYWALCKAVVCMNILPVSVNKNDPSDPVSLTTSHFEFYGVKPDYEFLFLSGAIEAFCRVDDGTYSRSEYDSQCLLGSTLGRSEFTNGMTFYNPILESFCTSVDYLIDKN